MSVECERASEDVSPCADSERLDTYVEAFLAVMPRRLGRKFLRTANEISLAKAKMSEAIPIRPNTAYAELSRARIAARLLHSKRLPAFLARIGAK